jgi:DNA-directed RNA polymerase specialized sigma24 family protein
MPRLPSFFRHESFKQSDARAARFRDLVMPLIPYLFRLGSALTGNRQSAESFVEASILHGCRHFDEYRGGEFRVWMAVIVENLCRMHMAETLDRECSEDVTDVGHKPEEEFLTVYKLSL